MKTAELLISFLDAFYEGKPITIVETGCMRSTSEGAEEGDGWSTLAFARWIKDHPDCSFYVIDISGESISTAIDALQARDLAYHVAAFSQADSVQQLMKMKHVDFAYLDTSDDLAHGLEEFQAAESKGAKRIIMDDYATKAQMAAVYAQSKGYKVERIGRFTVIDLHTVQG